jgi:hypothetical protein
MLRFAVQKTIGFVRDLFFDQNGEIAPDDDDLDIE